MAKSKFAGIFENAAPPDEPAPERVEKEAVPAPVREPAPEPALPTPPSAMNFKLTPHQGEALRLLHFKTGRTKQAVVSQALDEWLERNAQLLR